MKKWTEVSAGDINAANQRLWAAIGEDAEDAAHRVNNDPAFVAKVARFMKSGGYKPTTPEKLAREIMGKNFFGIRETIKHFRVKPTDQQLIDLDEIPWSEEVLRCCKDTHILIAVFPLSIHNICDITMKKLGRNLFYSYSSSNEESFAKDKNKAVWQLVRKDPVANSTSKTWEEHKAMLSKDEETPTTRVLIYTMVGYYFSTGNVLFRGIYVRSAYARSSCLKFESRCFCCVGYFGDKGILTQGCLDDKGYDDLGLAAARKQ